MQDNAPTPNAEKQRRHRYALMTEVRQIRADLEDLATDVRAVLAQQQAARQKEISKCR